MRTRPRMPRTRRMRSLRRSDPSIIGMSSVTSTSPSSVVQRVTSVKVSVSYERTAVAAASAGLSSHLPWSASPSSAPNTEPASKRGRQSQSIEPSSPTSAAVRQSPITAYSSIGLGMIRAGRVRGPATRLRATRSTSSTLRPSMMRRSATSRPVATGSSARYSFHSVTSTTSSAPRSASCVDDVYTSCG